MPMDSIRMGMHGTNRHPDPGRQSAAKALGPRRWPATPLDGSRIPIPIPIPNSESPIPNPGTQNITLAPTCTW
jgi:hypothetical protein